jgi:hypothetical protein
MSRRTKLLFVAAPVGVYAFFHLAVVASNLSGPDLGRIDQTWRVRISGYGMPESTASGAEIFVLRDMLREMRPSWNPFTVLAVSWRHRDRDPHPMRQFRALHSDWSVDFRKYRSDGGWAGIAVQVHAKDGAAYIHEWHSSQVVIPDFTGQDLLRRFPPPESDPSVSVVGEGQSPSAPRSGSQPSD